MILVFDEAAFPFPRLLQMLTGRAGLLRLKELAQAAVFAPYPLHRLASVYVAFGVGRDIDNTQVHADNAARCEGFGFRHSDRDCEVKRAVSEKQIGLTALSAQELFVFGRANERDFETTLNRVDADDLRFDFPGEKVFVEFDASER